MEKLLKQSRIADLAAMDNPLSKLQNAFNWTIEIQPDPKGPSIAVLVWDSMTWRRFLQSYYDWSYFWVDVNDNDYYKAFVEIVEDFKRNHLEGVRRTLTAFAMEYNPLHNYDKTVHEETQNSGVDTHTTEYGKTVLKDGSAAGNTTNAAGRQGRMNTSEIQSEKIDMIKVDANVGLDNGTEVSTSTKVATYDADEKDVSEVTSKGTTGIVTTSRASDKEVNEGKDILTDQLGTKVESDYTEKGNIGVTTAQQMLQAEYDLRMKINFEDELLAQLVKECFVLVP